MATVTELEVWIELDAPDTTAKSDSLASMIRGASKLNTVSICAFRAWGQREAPKTWWLPFYSALDACVTVTRIEVGIAVPELEAITERNSELARFIANPSTYSYRSDDPLPELLCRFDHCPTGHYTLVRCLPGIISFDEIQSATKRKQKK
jgi:hypothetical protein